MNGIFRVEKTEKDSYFTVIMEDRINCRQWVRRVLADDREVVNDLRKRFFKYMEKEGFKK